MVDIVSLMTDIFEFKITATNMDNIRLLMQNVSEDYKYELSITEKQLATLAINIAHIKQVLSQ